MKRIYYSLSIFILLLVAVEFLFELSPQLDILIKALIVVSAFSFPIIYSLNLGQFIENLSAKANKILDGDLTIKRSNVDKNEKLNAIDRALLMLSENINKSVDFIKNLEDGNLEAQYKKDENDNDLLGDSLISLRNKLKEISEQEKVRNWATEGLAKFVDILRSTDNDNLSTLSDRILNNLVKYLHANQGQLFILNDEEEGNKYLEMISFYAFTRKKHERIDLDSDEGLIGQAFKEKETIYLTEVPDDFVRVTSGLGEANPNCVLIVPLKVNDDVFGIIELASFDEFKDHEISFVEKLGESIASTISATKLNDKTKKLLEESQQASEEMRAQEEEMRQNMEELQATQEEVQRQMKENEKMQESLAKEKALLDSLLDTVPDLIYFKDRESKFIRMSKSMLAFFSAQSTEELIGKSDFDFHRKEAAQEYFDEEQEIIRTNKGFVDKIHHEIMESGKEKWSSTTKLPLIDKDKNTIGIFGITKDITSLKQAQLDAEQKSEELAAQEQVFVENMKELKELRAKMAEAKKEHKN